MADELAARAVGAQALIGGLRTIHRVAPAFDAYWFEDYAPVLSAGFRPPLAEGFQHFVKASRVAEFIHRKLDEELKAGKSDSCDPHPPLQERLAAVEHLPAGHTGETDPPATTLLGNLAGLEIQLLASMVKPEQAGKLQPIDWEEVPTRVYLPQWTALIQANVAVLGGVTPEGLPRSAVDLQALGQRLHGPDGRTVDDENAEGLACVALGAALAVQLLDRGGTAHTLPGQPISVTLGTALIEPFGIARDLADGKVAPEAWQCQCRELGILGMDLGKIATAA